jgi:hypothetical protein
MAAILLREHPPSVDGVVGPSPDGIVAYFRHLGMVGGLAAR